MSTNSTSIPSLRLLSFGSARNVGFFTFLAVSAFFRSHSLAVRSILGSHDLLRSSLLRKVTGRYCFTCEDSEAEVQGALELLAAAGSELLFFDRTQFSLDAALEAETSQCLIVMDFDELCDHGMETLVRLLFCHGAFPHVVGLVLCTREDTSATAARCSELLDALPAQTVVMLLRLSDEFLSEVPPISLTQAVGYQSFSRSFLQGLAEQVILVRGDINGMIDQLPNTKHRDSAYLGPAKPRRTRIAVSEDPCFSLLFQENLALLSHYGAEIVPFSPIADSMLPPDIGGIYFCGGCLFDYAELLGENHALLSDIEGFLEAGGVMYSEGAGTAFCASRFAVGSDPATLSSLAAFSGTARYHGFDREHVSEVVNLELLEETVLGTTGERIAALSLNDWQIDESTSIPLRTARVTRVDDGEYLEGYSPGPQSFCTFLFLKFLSAPYMADRFVDNAEVTQRNIASTKRK